VANVDAATDSFGVLDALCYVEEPGWIEAGSILEKDDYITWSLAKACVQLAHRRDQRICLSFHLLAVMDDQAADPARKAAGEFPHHSSAPLVQHIDPTV
jgi:hypothetical protein